MLSLTEILQSSLCRAWVRAAATLDKPLVGSTSCLGWEKTALQCTDRRTPKRSEREDGKRSLLRSIYCTGVTGSDHTQTIQCPPSHFRSGDDWLVGEKEKDVLLKAPVGLDPNQPPTTGWQVSKKVTIWEGADFQTQTNDIKSRAESSRMIQVCCAPTRGRSPAARSQSL